MLASRLGGHTTDARNDAAAAAAAAADADPAFSEFVRCELGVDLQQQPTILAELPGGAGRGLVAARRIARGQLAAYVPASAVVTAAVAAQESPLLRRARRDGNGNGSGGLTEELPDWTSLAVWLMEQQHALLLVDEEKQDQQSSRWRPYIERLPKAGTMGTVLEWHPLQEGGSDNDPGPDQQRLRRREALVAEDLAGSGLRHKAAEILAAADATWREVSSAAAAAAAALMAAGEESAAAPYASRARLEWALSVLLSRVVRLDSAPGAPSALVPWCDFLNHAPQAACYLDLQEEGQGRRGGEQEQQEEQEAAVVGVRVDRAYNPGEQVFISYGPKSSGELLLSYGFCPPPKSNASNDRAFVQVGVGRSSGGGKEGETAAAAAAAAKRRALARRGIPTVETFALRADALPEGLLPYVAFADAELLDGGSGGGDAAADAADDDAAADRAAEALAAAIFPDGGIGERDAAARRPGTGLPSADLERVAWRGVAARCRAALADYTTTEDQDRALAASVPWLQERGAFAGDVAERRAALADVRLRERRILGAAMFAATGQAMALGGVGGGATGRRR
jgi:hypothetical protein